MGRKRECNSEIRGGRKGLNRRRGIFVLSKVSLFASPATVLYSIQCLPNGNVKREFGNQGGTYKKERVLICIYCLWRFYHLVTILIFASNRGVL